MNFRQFAVNFVLITFIVFAMIMVGVNLQVENQANQTITSIDAINDAYQDYNSSLGALYTDTNTQRDSFNADVGTVGEVDLNFRSVIGIGKVLINSITGFWNITIGLLAKVLGIPSTVVGIFGAILIIVAILLAYKLYKTGD